MSGRKTAGIGHNQGPDLNDNRSDIEKDDADRDRRRRIIGGSNLSEADIAWLREREKTGQLSKVIWTSVSGSTAAEGRINYLSSGRADGLISRGGYRRITHAPTQEERDRLDDGLFRLKQITRNWQGRNAEIFRRHHLNPLDGIPAPSIKETAAQYGITEKRVYNILDDAKLKVRQRLRGEFEPVKISAPPKWSRRREYTDGPLASGIDQDGRFYIDWVVCDGDDLHPDPPLRQFDAKPKKE
jgi:hypothetical protein